MTNLFRTNWVEIEIPSSYAAQISSKYCRCLKAQSKNMVDVPRPMPSYMEPVTLSVQQQSEMYWDDIKHLSAPMYVPTRNHFQQHLVWFTSEKYTRRQSRLDLFQWHKWYKSDFPRSFPF